MTSQFEAVKFGFNLLQILQDFDSGPSSSARLMYINERKQQDPSKIDCKPKARKIQKGIINHPFLFLSQNIFVMIFIIFNFYFLFYFIYDFSNIKNLFQVVVMQTIQNKIL